MLHLRLGGTKLQQESLRRLREVVREAWGVADEQDRLRRTTLREGLQAGSDQGSSLLVRPSPQGDAVTKMTPVSGFTHYEIRPLGQKPDSVSSESPPSPGGAACVGGYAVVPGRSATEDMMG